MEEKTYSEVSIKIIEQKGNWLESIKQKAFEDYFCGGSLDFFMDEPEVDRALGERAYSGESIPENVLETIEASQDFEAERWIKLFFYEEDHKSNVDNFQKYLEVSFPGIIFEKELKPWIDWNSEWRKSFETIKVSNNLKIVPEWEKEDWKDKKEALFIYPGMGFGTGNHETTYLCLKIVDDLVHKKKVAFDNCLDFGCGSGILGIAALKLIENLSIDFCDLEIEALENCKNNLEINFKDEALGKCRLVSRERFLPVKKYNLVFANILEHVLLKESSLLDECLLEGGHLILSGILLEQRESIKEEFSLKGFLFLEEKVKGAWAALLFKKERS
tara:strand:+ start:4176 stop:5168 length:993 start_codon:yes stop_codon:yes gene_type:complete